MTAQQTTIWWLWNERETDGTRCYLAYNKEYPVMPDGGDPLTLGDPVFSGTRAEVGTFAAGHTIYFHEVKGRDD